MTFIQVKLTMMRTLALLSLFAALMAGSGCGSKEESADSPAVATEAEATTPEKSDEKEPETHTHADGTVHAGATHSDDKPDGIQADPNDPLASLSDQEKKDRNRIKFKLLKPGTGGLRAAKGDTLTMLYEGRLTNGTKFDGNYDGSREPFQFTVGSGVIQGWSLAMVSMKVGEETEITIPPDLGYGEQGAGSSIPANATLVFKVKVLDIIKPNEQMVYDVLSKTPGSGPAVKEGDKIQIHLTTMYTNGSQLSTTKGKEPLTFTVGNKEVSMGLENGVIGMQAGAKWRLRFPPQLVMKGSEYPQIPSPQTLWYDVELIKIVK